MVQGEGKGRRFSDDDGEERTLAFDIVVPCIMASATVRLAKGFILAGDVQRRQIHLMDPVSMVTWPWRALIDAVVPWTIADTFGKG